MQMEGSNSSETLVNIYQISGIISQETSVSLVKYGMYINLYFCYKIARFLFRSSALNVKKVIFFFQNKADNFILYHFCTQCIIQRF
jgi:hypothetical protein